MNIALGEGYLPLGIFEDKYYEEMSFPTRVYEENIIDDTVYNFSYQNIIQWEILHKDHDFAYHATNIFIKLCALFLT